MPFTDAGYHRMTYAEWLEHDIALAQKLFGDDIDTSEATPLGKYIRLNCEDKRDLGEEIEDVYYSFNYLTATGSALRRLCANVGLSISAGEYATHTVVFTGTVGYTIEAGTGVATTDKSVSFHTINDCTIGEDGTVTTTVECDELGTVGNVDAGEITVLTYNNANITSVSGSVIVSLGEDVESDTAVREKYTLARNATGSGTYAAILGAVYQVTGVESAYLEYNKTMYDTDDLPAKSFRVSVLASESLAQEIAEAIFSKMPLLSNDIGDVTVTVTDEWNREHEVHFSWTEKKLIYVYVKLLVDSDWGSSSEDEAVEAIAEHINSLSNGETVYLYDIYTSLKGITGKLNILDMQIGTSADEYGTDDITIKTTQVARTDASCIVIEVESV